MRLSALRFLFFAWSSLPDLIRQSMRKKGFIGFADRSFRTAVSMDRRVKPGGDEE
jgi:hypothetical protein